MNKQREGQPPIESLHPAPERVERAWQNRNPLYGLRPTRSSMTQCELEACLGGLINFVLTTRASAEDAEMKALRLRWDEAEALESISECRYRLGLPDGAISQSARGGR